MTLCYIAIIILSISGSVNSVISYRTVQAMRGKHART